MVPRAELLGIPLPYLLLVYGQGRGIPGVGRIPRNPAQNSRSWGV